MLSRVLNGKSLADVYQLGMSMQDSAAIAGLAVINPVLGKVGTVLLSTSSGTDAMLDAVSRGASDEQALTMGILTAGFEMIFEKYELESLLGQGTNVWQVCWRQGLSEWAGEGATEISNILADIAVMAEKSQWSQNISRYLEKHPDWGYNEAAKQAFIDAAVQVGEASFGGLISGSAMGSGYAANTRVNQAYVAKRLMAKGFNPEKSAKMADAIAARLNGQELTTIQKERLRSAMDSGVVRDVMSDITKKRADEIDSVQNDVYDKIKTPGGNAVTENSASRQEQNATLEGTEEGDTVAKKPYATSRPSYGKGQIEQVWEMNKDSTGKVWDPFGAELIWDPTRPRNGQWDMGHLPEHKYSVWHQKYIDDELSLEEFLEWYRNPAHYRPELPSTNRSHKYE